MPSQELFQSEFEAFKRATNEKLDTMMQTQAQILDLLKGNQFNNKDQGMLGQLYEHSRRIQKLETMMTRAVWTAVGMTPGFSWGIYKFLIEFFTHK